LTFRQKAGVTRKVPVGVFAAEVGVCLTFLLEDGIMRRMVSLREQPDSQEVP
jgi:hypothetical protein